MGGGGLTLVANPVAPLQLGRKEQEGTGDFERGGSTGKKNKVFFGGF